jgi:DNA polymerase I-like protein with 3'-5' exonuclease and polymerase domains
MPEMNKILNFPVQSTGADIIDGALIHLWYSLRQIQSWPLFQVHDALIVETPYPRECCRRMWRWMCKPVTLDGRSIVFPVEFKVGPAWGIGTEYKHWREVPPSEKEKANDRF